MSKVGAPNDASRASQVNALDYRSFFEGVPVGLYRVALDGRILEANAVVADRVGRPREALIGANVADFYADPAQRDEFARRMLADGKVDRFLFRVKRGDGAVIWVEDSARAVRDESGQVVYFEGTLEDVTAREDALTALKASEARYRALVESIPAATYVVSPDGITTTHYVSPQIEPILGFPQSDWTETSSFWLSRLHEADRDCVLAEIRAAAAGERPFRCEYRLIARDGRVVWVRDEAALVRSESGEPLCFQGLITDVTASRQATDALREREERLRMVAEQMPVTVWSTDHELRLTAATGAGTQALGLSPGRSVGTTLTELFGAEASVVLESRRALLGEPVRFEAQWRGRLFQVGVGPLRDAGGDVAGSVGVALDVTEAREAEQMRARLQAIVEAATDFVGIAGADRRVIYVNPAGLALLGIPKGEDLSGAPLADCHPRWAAALVEDVVIPAVMRKGAWSGELALLSRAGREVPVSAVIVAHPRPGGELEFLSIIARDIGERRRAEEMVRRQAEFAERLIDSSVDGIVAFDTEYRLTIWNATMVRVTGLTEAETLGRSVFEVFPFMKDTGDDQFFREALEGKTVVAKDRPYYLPAGRKGIFEGHYSPLLDARGEVVGGLVFVRDVTDRKSLEEQFRQSQKMEAVGRLAGGVAHDFNNLLTVITGFTELLTMGAQLGETHRQYAREILGAADKAASLTQQLLAFSRRQVLQPKVLSLNSVVSEMERLLSRLIGEDIELVLEASHSLGRVRADPNQLEQVVLNLAVNARDAMPEGGRLLIETDNADLTDAYARRFVDVEPGRYVMLSVSDTGTGMEATVKERIFEPFFTTKKRGTGLGLATVYGIVKQSGGHIEVESEPGKGSTFRVFLPRVDQSGERGLSERTERPRGGTETVLVIEDEDAVRDLSRLILASYGYTVLDARGVDEAQRIGRDHPGTIHLLLSDVVLPGMPGPKVAQSLAAARPELRVVYMSGYTDEAISHHGVLDERTSFLKKPFTPEALARKVRETLDAPPPAFQARRQPQ